MSEIKHSKRWDPTKTISNCFTFLIRIGDTESDFLVKYFDVQDDWEIEINLGPEDPPETTVYRKEGDQKTELDPVDTKELHFPPRDGESTSSGQSGQSCFASGGAYFSGAARVISSIIDCCASAPE